MAEDIKLTATVAVEDPFKVGSSFNKFSVTITNEGTQLTQKPPNRQFFYLDSIIGSDEKALFNDKGDVVPAVAVIQLPDGWKYEWDFTIDMRARLKIFTNNPGILGKLGKGQSLEVKLSNIISRTAPGQATVTFSSSFQLDKSVPLPITKSADNPDIISFTSNPPEGTPNLPGENVTLTWLTYKLPPCELIQLGSPTPLPPQKSVEDPKTNTRQEEKTITCGSSVMTFTLTGKDGERRIKKTLQVNALSDGWKAGTQNVLFQGDPGDPATESAEELVEALKYPIQLQPTMLFNAKGSDLYGVFQHGYKGKKRALLFRTSNPFGTWRLVESGVQDQPGLHIPEGHATSPGVCADNTLWLLGGSLVDPDNTSNEVWCFNLTSKQWECHTSAQWCPRMGHAALKFGNGIWIMGGRDEAGNALNDVWALDLKTHSWKQVVNGKEHWDPRCLFYPAVFKNKIWLYGGAEEPFAENLFDDLWVYDGVKWDQKHMTDALGGSTPITSSLLEFKDKLLLICKVRKQSESDTSELIETLGFSLETESAKTWSSFSIEGLKNWGADTTFSLQLVNFKDRMLIANALVYQRKEANLQIYVSSI